MSKLAYIILKQVRHITLLHLPPTEIDVKMRATFARLVARQLRSSPAWLFGLLLETTIRAWIRSIHAMPTMRTLAKSTVYKSVAPFVCHLTSRAIFLLIIIIILIIFIVIVMGNRLYIYMNAFYLAYFIDEKNEIFSVLKHWGFKKGLFYYYY